MTLFQSTQLALPLDEIEVSILVVVVVAVISGTGSGSGVLADFSDGFLAGFGGKTKGSFTPPATGLGADPGLVTAGLVGPLLNGLVGVGGATGDVRGDPTDDKGVLLPTDEPNEAEDLGFIDAVIAAILSSDVGLSGFLGTDGGVLLTIFSDVDLPLSIGLEVLTFTSLVSALLPASSSSFSISIPRSDMACITSSKNEEEPSDERFESLISDICPLFRLVDLLEALSTEAALST